MANQTAIGKTPMRGKFLLDCDCGAESAFVVVAVDDGLEIDRALHGCDCPGRPDESEALELATEEFTDRLEARHWSALYSRYPEEV